MIEGGTQLGAISKKGFRGAVNAFADFGIAVGEGASCKAKSDIGVFPERIGDAEFGIDVSRGHGHAQSEISLVQETRLVCVIEDVGGEGLMTFKGAIIAHLDEFAMVRI